MSDLLGVLLHKNKDILSIPATVMSDDGNVNIAFNAIAYFEHELQSGRIDTVFEELDSCDFDADYATDHIAEFFAQGATQRLFDYLAALDGTLDIGYRCTVDKESAFHWLQEKGRIAMMQSKSAS